MRIQKANDRSYDPGCDTMRMQSYSAPIWLGSAGKALPGGGDAASGKPVFDSYQDHSSCGGFGSFAPSFRTFRLPSNFPGCRHSVSFEATWTSGWEADRPLFVSGVGKAAVRVTVALRRQRETKLPLNNAVLLEKRLFVA